MPLCPRRGWCPGRDVCDPRRSFEPPGEKRSFEGNPGRCGLRARGPGSSFPFLYSAPRPCLMGFDRRPPRRRDRARARSATPSATGVAVRRGLVGETWFPPRLTERAGFEPATHLSARTRFPVALLRPLGHLSVLRSGEGGIRTLDGGIHPHNALAGRRLQPLGHFSAGPREDSRLLSTRSIHGQSVILRQPSRRLRGRRLSATCSRRIGCRFADPPSGGGKHPPQHENEFAGSPLIPRQSETRLRLPEAGFAFQGDYDTVIVSFIPAASWPGMVQ